MATISLKEQYKRQLLGNGVLAPLARVQGNDFSSAEGEPLIKAAVKQIMHTRPGQLRWRPSFGLDIEEYRHTNNTPNLAAQLASEIGRQVALWEPRLNIVDAAASIQPEDPSAPTVRNKIDVKITWTVTTEASASSAVLVDPVVQEETL
jgi:phage baseplate assembly protein W